VSETNLQIAIANFVDHCQAIPESLGSPGVQTPAFSVNQHTLNIPYPNGITIADGEHVDTQIAQIKQMLAARPPDAGTSVVDSYSELFLGPLGFEPLFTTPWFFRSPKPLDVEPVGAPRIPRIEVVNAPVQLHEFDRAAAVGFAQSNADTVYSLPLLSDNRYRFYFIRQANQIVAGVQTFTNDSSVGIYTLFTLPEYQQIGFARSLLNRVILDNPNLPAITNPDDQSEHLFASEGFTHIGTRTVWRFVQD
jgi:hypothetical protein